MHVARKVATLAGIAALALPAAAIAGSDKGEDHGGKGGKDRAHYQVKGTYLGDGVVEADKVNGHARKAGWRGQQVEFSFEDARIRVADTNGDGEQTIDDVVAGDRVRVKARLAKRDPGAGPYAAERLDDRTNPKGDSDDEGEEDGE